MQPALQIPFQAGHGQKHPKESGLRLLDGGTGVWRPRRSTQVVGVAKIDELESAGAFARSASEWGGSCLRSERAVFTKGDARWRLRESCASHAGTTQCGESTGVL